MAIPEACGLWIEQRVPEELEAKTDSLNLSKIDWDAAQDIEQLCETRVKSDTIRKKAAWTFFQTKQTSETTTENTKSNEIKRNQTPYKDGTMRGGLRQNASRPPKPTGDARNGINLSRINGAIRFATIAISFLEKIPADDPLLNHALDNAGTGARSGSSSLMRSKANNSGKAILKGD